MRATWILMLGAVLLIGGCGEPKVQMPAPPAPAPAPGPQPAPQPTPEPVLSKITVEVEVCKLTDAKIVDLAGAGGGKAVVITGDAGSAETSVNLKKGRYTVTVFVYAPSYEEDAFYLSVGGGMEHRLFPEDAQKLLPAESVDHAQVKDGPCKIVLSFGEENVQLDRVEIVPAK